MMPAKLKALAIFVPMTAMIIAMTELIAIIVTANSSAKPFFRFI